MSEISKYGLFEVALTGPSEGNPFTDVQLSADFCCGNRRLTSLGFYDGAGRYKVRFMPDKEGKWSYKTKSNIASLDGAKGEFLCVPAKKGNHGPVRVENTYHFAYDDGTPYFPFGTTCYAFVHQDNGLVEETLSTLKSSPFNKIRMCVFPKFYEYNHNEPPLYPYAGDLKDGFDFKRFNPEYFKNIEEQIENLGELGIEADLILFHPYDKWGFAKMNREANLLYLRYIIARFSCYQNVWWSLANEYDHMKHLNRQNWEEFADVILKCDYASHLRSIHNGAVFYDYSTSWSTHCSLQATNTYQTTDQVNKFRLKYNKPVVFDEVCYEGNIQLGWGNITAKELTRRFWEAYIRGGYCTHGETYLNDDEVLWWSKGGKLYGDSPERIAFLRGIIEEAPMGGIAPLEGGEISGGDLPVCVPEKEITEKSYSYMLCYFGFNRPKFRDFNLPDGDYSIDVIDTWNMKIKRLPGLYKGEVRVELPGEQYMAIRFKKA